MLVEILFWIGFIMYHNTCRVIVIRQMPVYVNFIGTDLDIGGSRGGFWGWTPFFSRKVLKIAWKLLKIRPKVAIFYTGTPSFFTGTPPLLNYLDPRLSRQRQSKVSSELQTNIGWLVSNQGKKQIHNTLYLLSNLIPFPSRKPYWYSYDY